jgi:hypothetical protein
MIRHSVIFKLRPTLADAEVKLFFDAAAALAKIPGVSKFEILKQVSTKNNFEYGISMEFSTTQQYSEYNVHPSHSDFINKYWMPFVEDFLEIDYEDFNLP